MGWYGMGRVTGCVQKTFFEHAHPPALPGLKGERKEGSGGGEISFLQKKKKKKEKEKKGLLAFAQEEEEGGDYFFSSGT